MKKLLIILGIALLFSCEKEDEPCWICSMKNYTKVNGVWMYVDKGVDIFCGEKPRQSCLNCSGIRYTCNEI